MRLMARGTLPFRRSFVIFRSQAFGVFRSFALLYRLELCGSPNFFTGEPQAFRTYISPHRIHIIKKENKEYVQNYRFHLLHAALRRMLQ